MTDSKIKINYEKLESDVKNAINAEEKYWRENSAKMKAIDQRVVTYEDFRQMVLASHLKPLDKGETLQSGFHKNVWNSVAQGTKDDENLKLSSKQSELKNVIPVNSLDFMRIWKKLPDYAEKWQYIISIGVDAFISLFLKEINGEIIGQFFVLFCNIIETTGTEENVDIVFKLLLQFPKCNRFKLNLLFLKKEEINSCKSLFETLAKKLKDPQITHLNSLKSLYI